MGFFDALMFWKRKEPMPLEPGIPLPGMASGAPNFDDPTLNTGMEQFNPDKPFPGINQQQQPMPPMMQQPSTPSGYMLDMANQPRAGFAQSMQDQKDIIINKNFEVISSKLDALQASLESINQRIRNIERIAQIEQQKATEKRYSY